MSDNLYIQQVYNVMHKNNIICAYHGDFNYNVINSLLITIKNKLNQNEHLKRAAKKTYKVVVECLENVHKHSNVSAEQKDDGSQFFRTGFFVLVEDKNGYKVTVGNFINNENQDELEQKIIQVNKLNNEELKKTYNEVLMSTSISEKGGASLGIIDMVLKSGSKLNYTFHKHNSSASFFVLEVNINN